MEILIIVGVIFLAWLMYSSKVQKESFLFYVWSAMIGIGSLHLAYLLLFK